MLHGYALRRSLPPPSRTTPRHLSPTSLVPDEDVSHDRRAALEDRWLSLQTDAPAKARGKPSAEQLAALRAHAALVKGWMATLSTTEKAFVTSLKKRMRRARATKTCVSRTTPPQRAIPQKTAPVSACQHNTNVEVREQHCWCGVVKKFSHQTFICVLLATSVLLMSAYR